MKRKSEFSGGKKREKKRNWPVQRGNEKSARSTFQAKSIFLIVYAVAHLLVCSCVRVCFRSESDEHVVVVLDK